MTDDREMTARHRNSSAHPGWFTTAYFHRPDELEREVAAAGFQVRALVAVEGAVGAAAEAHTLDDWIDDPVRREVLLRAIRRVEAEPSLLGASPHVIAFATRPEAPRVSRSRAARHGGRVITRP